jgi:hypothetical protein
MSARQVFMFAPSPGKFVCVTVGGEFDSDIWQALNGFVKQMEVRPVVIEPTAICPKCGNDRYARIKRHLTDLIAQARVDTPNPT